MTECDIISQGYYITDRCKSENYKRYTSMNCTKGTHELKKGISRAEQGGLKEKTLDGQPLIHYATAKQL